MGRLSFRQNRFTVSPESETSVARMTGAFQAALAPVRLSVRDRTQISLRRLKDSVIMRIHLRIGMNPHTVPFRQTAQ